MRVLAILLLFHVYLDATIILSQSIRSIIEKKKKKKNNGVAVAFHDQQLNSTVNDLLQMRSVTAFVDEKNIHCWAWLSLYK